MARFQTQICLVVLVLVNLMAVCLAADYGRITPSQLSKYKPCSAGCCRHEACAHKRICYPKIKCRYGCPDGECSKGECVPYTPCNSPFDCGIANTCTMHYNLGYKVCQYNLKIGSTLCYRKRSIIEQSKNRALNKRK